MTANSPAIQEAIQLYHDGKHQESRDCLSDFLAQQPANIDALLWLAKVSPDPQESVSAAELALKLDPTNEVAQRAVIAVREREDKRPDEAELQAAVATSIGMTLAQARSVNWPFRGINCPIGEALDDGTITLRDLWWAVENAHNSRIREAAKTILLTQLVGVEPKEPPPPLRVIIGSRYSEAQERRSLIFFGLASGIGLTLMILLGTILAITVTRRVENGWRLPAWGMLVLYGAVAVAFIIMRWSDSFANLADQYRSGRWGEERVVDQLRFSLDGHWTLYRNFEWPNRRWGDIDLALVGPGGIWAMEVKAYSGQSRNVGDQWERKRRQRWRKMTKHPGKQARLNASRLNKYLQGHNVDVGWVQPVVVWAEGNLIVDDPAVPVWTLEDLPDHIEEIWQSRSLSQETAEKAVEVLNTAIENLA